MSSMRMRIISGVAVTALSLPALEASARSPQDAPAPGNAVVSEAEAEAGPVQFAPVYVTAQKRLERALDIPMSVEVYSGAELERRHLMTTRDVLSTTPNVMMGGGVTGAAFTPYVAIRGVGSSEYDSDPSVGLFLDGVPLTESQSYTSSLLDMDRVEILRGPQGTLYGRNTLGGSVNLITNVPDPTARAGKIEVSGGNHGQFRTEVMANVPVVQNRSAVRGAFAFDRSSGYTNNFAPGEKDANAWENYHGRLGFLSALGDATTASVSFEVQKQNLNDGANTPLAAFRRGQNSVNTPNAFAGDLRSLSGRIQVDHEFQNGLTLTSLTGVRNQVTEYSGRKAPPGYFANMTLFGAMMGIQDYDPRSRTRYEGDFTQVSQELRLASAQGERLQYVVGLYGDWSNARRVNSAGDTWGGSVGWAHPEFGPMPALFPGSTGANVSLTGETDAWSVATFADGSYRVSDTWDVFGGLRVGYDVKDYDFRMGSDLPAYVALMLPNAAGDLPISAFSNRMGTVYVTPKAGLRYNFNADNNAYFSVARGYKSGGFNNSLIYSMDESRYGDESLINYELGMKNALFDGRLVVESALFFIDWRDQQVLCYDSATNATPIMNAKRSRSYGFDISARADLGYGFSLGGGAGFADATYRDFKNAPRTGAPGTVNASGKQQQYHSRFTSSVQLGYEQEVGFDDLRAFATVGYRYRSKFYFDPANTVSQGGYGMVDASIGVENDRYGLSLWGRNLSNKRVLSSATHYNGDGVLVTQGEPLMFGATAFLKF
ncbi:TonB-dependent receptor [Phaeovibrio sulfidiphilus]|uniref:TonB-dependent receptor n=1 Tax=Phaeovibrio sulfidiphilus TaxID=1220600 RepID=A0A8J7CDQ5_9PROT|nr:TonB-dependent receptor [Phaeovibrio sulfidiphilus]MBE1237998.1 TonB-dependent receptor [Phaeovibrio sulfidiphilus]